MSRRIAGQMSSHKLIFVAFFENCQLARNNQLCQTVTGGISLKTPANLEGRR